MKKRLGISVALALSVGCIILVSNYENLFGPDDVPTDAKVRLNAPFSAIDFAPFYVAKEKGWIEESLAEVGAVPEYLDPFQSIATTNEALATNRVDLVLTSGIPPIIGKAGGIDMKITWLSCTLDSEVVVPTSSEVRSLADLKGKRVATLSGSSSHYWMVKNLEAAGLKPADIEFVHMLPPDGKIAFKSGAVDAWAMFPPWPEQELFEGAAKVLPGFIAPIQVVLVGRGEFLKTQPSQTQAVVEALDRAKEWIALNPEQAQLIVSKHIDLSLDIVKLAWPKMRWEAELDAEVITDIQGKADFLKSEGLIERSMNVQEELIFQPAPRVDTKLIMSRTGTWSYLLPLALPLLLLVAWEVIIRCGWIPQTLIASPWDVLKNGREMVMDGRLVRHSLVSMRRLLSGFTLGCSAALFLGVAVGLSRTAEKLIATTIALLAPVPVTAWIPLVIIVAGIGELSKAVVISIGAFFPIFFATFQGIRSAEPKLVEVAQVFGKSRLQLVWTVLLPSAASWIFHGMRTALGLSWIILIVAELIASSEGLGWLMWDARNFARPEDMIVGMIAAGVLGFATDRGLSLLERWFVFWRSSFEGE